MGPSPESLAGRRVGRNDLPRPTPKQQTKIPSHPRWARVFGRTTGARQMISKASILQSRRAACDTVPQASCRPRRPVAGKRWIAQARLVLSSTHRCQHKPHASLCIPSRSTLPDDFSGRNAVAGICVTPDGRFLYVSNRGHNSIAQTLNVPKAGSIAFCPVLP